MTELKDWLNSINFNKTNLIEEDPSTIKDYAPYIINRCLSGNIDCILFTNEMNSGYTGNLAFSEKPNPTHRLSTFLIFGQENSGFT